MALWTTDWPLRGRSIRFWATVRSHFMYVVEDYFDMDADIKSSVMNVSSSVVSIITRTGKIPLFEGSGTIIEYDQEQGFATVLTSATLVRSPSDAAVVPSDLEIEVYLFDGKLYEGQLSVYDFHYNIATIKIKSTTPVSVATIRYIDDSITMDLITPILVKHSTRFKLCPGERVIALARDCKDDREVMASPGVFSVRDCRHDCKELFLTSCVVTEVAIGGPLVNGNGEVIGVNFFICPFTAFVPINVVSKCLEDLKRKGQVSRPWLGANIANLYSADLDKLDMLYQKFPNLSGGVIVEQVFRNKNTGSKNRTKIPHWTVCSPRNWLKAKAMIQNNRKRERMIFITRRAKRSKSRMRKWQKSPAADAGLCAGDVIIKCGDVSVQSHLQLVEELWDKEGKALDLVLMRPSIGQKTVTLTVGTFPGMPKWLHKRKGTMIE